MGLAVAKGILDSGVEAWNRGVAVCGLRPGRVAASGRAIPASRAPLRLMMRPSHVLRSPAGHLAAWRHCFDATVPVKTLRKRKMNHYNPQRLAPQGKDRRQGR